MSRWRQSGGVALVASVLAGCVLEGDVLVPSGGRRGEAGGPGNGGVGGAPAASGPVLTVDFEDVAPGPFDEPSVVTAFGTPRFSESTRASVVDAGGNRFLRVAYPLGGVGPQESGAQWLVDLPASADAARLAFRVRFEAGFDWVRGGMLPGLAGGTANSGGNVPDGTDGFSARFNWRTEGTVTQFVYYPDQANTFGEHLELLQANAAPRLVGGVWYTFSLDLRLNTPGRADGMLEAWVTDGTTLVASLRRADLRFRDAPSLQVDALFFSTFFGGSTVDWAASRAEQIDFDDFEVVLE